jgi:hypothetical protein
MRGLVILQVACRDYPHPRSACAKNPFSTTSHERHCDKVLSVQLSKLTTPCSWYFTDWLGLLCTLFIKSGD